MKNILIINGHEHYVYSPGKLNEAMQNLAMNTLTEKGYNVQTTVVQNGYNVQEELDKHVWADCIIIQSPVNWMMVPWTLKKYFDEVFTAGMGGILCQNDGRVPEAPKRNYGTGGVLTSKKYMLSLTFNAPEEAFNNPDEYLFRGKSVDDLFFPVHMNYRFFGMEALPTFAAFDVMKNPAIEADFERYKAELNKYF